MKSFPLVLTFFLLFIYHNNAQNIIEIPIELVNGFGPFVPYADVITKQNPDSKYAKLELDVIGIPEDWENQFVENIQFDPKQFFYQNYREGLIDQEWFNELNLDLNSRNFSEVPIRCIYGSGEK